MREIPESFLPREKPIWGEKVIRERDFSVFKRVSATQGMGSEHG